MSFEFYTTSSWEGDAARRSIATHATNCRPCLNQPELPADGTNEGVLVKTAIIFISCLLTCTAAELTPSGLRIPAVFLSSGNEGPGAARFATWNAPGSLEASAGGLRFGGHGTPVSMVFVNPNLGVEPEGTGPVSARFSWLNAGGGAAARNLAAFQGVVYRNIYDGIDFVVRLSGGEVKSEYRLRAGVPPGQIRFRYREAALSIRDDGSLRIHTAGGDLFDSAPELYQMNGHVKNHLRGAFHIYADGSAGFEIGAYDRSLPLIIDPVLGFTAEFNGNQNAVITAIAADARGYVYATGYTPSANFPVANPFQAWPGGGNDVFVLKLNPSGAALEYATYLGGSGDDRAFGIAIDSAGQATIAGQTSSRNFPLFSPVQPVPGGGMDAFVAKLNPAGDGLVFSTLLGGNDSDAANAVAVDRSGNVYVTGDTTSVNFPILSAYQSQIRGGQDAFVAKISAYGSLLYSTYLGGNSADHGGAIAIDAAGNAYVTGSTYSTDFPLAAAFQPHTGGGQDAFVTKLNVQGSGLVFSTYLGGSGGSPAAPETGAGIGVDSGGYVYVAGTTSSLNFPLQAPLQNVHSYGTEMFLTKFAPAGSTVAFSTYLGGSSYDYANALLVDSTGCVYIAGQTSSWDFPAPNNVQGSLGGMTDAFVIKINNAGNTIASSSYLGGSGLDAANAVALDHQGNLFLAGTTQSSNFPQLRGIPAQSHGVVTGFVSSISGIGDHGPMLQRFYLGFFNRGADPSGLADWTAALDQGSSPAAVANNFFYSPEFYSSGVLIGAAYLAVQGKDPDFAGFEGFMPQIRSGAMASPVCLNGPPPNNTILLCSQLALIQTFMSSGYYQTTYGALNNSQFVTAAYQKLMNQTPAPAILNSTINQLSGGLTRAQFLQTLMNGSQYTAAITNTLLVDMCYFVFLQRNPDPSGYQNWLSALKNGLTPVGLFGGFVFSTEFLQSL